MRRKQFFWLCMVFLTFIVFVQKASAIEDPLKLPNNKIGIHILFPEELRDSAKLVNSNNGDWGYVVIPIQAGDRDLLKWQRFMTEAKALHVIPIIRLATEGDYFNTKAWRTPKETDVLDFANFLNSLDWPVINRYVIIFNEVNRADEWGTQPDPKAYARLLSYAVTVFKSKSQDFYILSAGLDNAADNISAISINEYDFLRQMNQEVPGIFFQIDGVASHSYPNPGFSQPPSKTTSESITSFRYEKSLFSFLTTKDLPIFITETGWSEDVLSEDTIPVYYSQAFSSVWTDKDIVVVAPFLLRAGSGPFKGFSFLKDDGSKTLQYQLFENLAKTKGTPTLGKSVLGETIVQPSNLPVKNFSGTTSPIENSIIVPLPMKAFVKMVLKIE